uniref:ArpA protein - Streptomyces griseus n=1 Tax=uncultured Thiotrichaceae bacterium TaxID=298394 RepID=A0A6S6S422_9GAMM|nr:MAG: arpA protein - Streptomyces griseus [uncultured Thiotrichaceae bacterium]
MTSYDYLRCKAFFVKGLDSIVNTETFPINNVEFQMHSRNTLRRDGAFIMEGFLKPAAIQQVKQEAEDNQQHAYFCQNKHTVYLSPPDTNLPENHTRNHMIESSKGCITDDVIPTDSPLRTLYDSSAFKDFLATVLEEKALYEYADPMSSINIHYARTGQELGWHFDNSSFAITLMIQEAEQGGVFEYVGGMRDSGKGDMNYEGVEQVLQGEVDTKQLAMKAGSLVMFRGRDAIHRVTPNEGETTRLLVVLAYNSQPGIALEDEAMKNFYGRVA